MQIKNPANGQVIKDIPADSGETIKSKFEILKQAQKEWSKIPLKKRLDKIAQYQKLVNEDIKDLAADLTREMGKPLQESVNEINAANGRIDFFLNESEKWLKPKKVADDGTTKEILTFEPLGVVANISAWNYPYLVGTNVFIPALIAGNSVMYKPSEFTVLTGLNIEAKLKAAGIPDGVFQVIIGEGAVGNAMLDCPLDGVFFTGSVATGKKIQEKVGPKLIPLGLELGGKDPVYVADDIKNINKVAQSLVEGAFYNNGQSCCAVERIYVQKNIEEKFNDAFVRYLEKWQVGDPVDKKNLLGCLARPQHASFLAGLVQDALDKGAFLAFQNKNIPHEGSYFPPTVLAHVTHDMRVMKEETFGPVIGIQAVENDEEALALMNDTKFGLTAGVFSESQERAEKILNSLDVGNCYWNCSDRVSPYLPWAGRRNSGLGATLSYLGILSFTKPKGYHWRSL